MYVFIDFHLLISFPLSKNEITNQTRMGSFCVSLSLYLISVSYTLVDDSNNTGDTSKRAYRRESFIDDYRHRSNSNGDDQQSTIINFFPSRRNVIF